MGLERVDKDAFACLSSLRVLSISQNHLKHLPEELLYPMPALEQLLLGGKTNAKGLRIFQGNELETFPQKLLEHSPHLRVLDVSENNLREIPEDGFAGNQRLEILDLQSNSISELAAKTFAGLNNLRRLDLQKNQLTQLPPDLLAGLDNLQSLNLNDNELG